MELVARIARGEEKALAELYDSTSRMIYGLVLRIVRDAATAEEVTLEVYMQVWRTAANYTPDRGSVNAWLATAARSRALDWLRSRQARLARDGQPMDSLPEITDTAANPEAALAERTQAAVIRKAMASLPAEQREAIDLGFYSGLTHGEIAAQLNLPLGTVKSRIRMGMNKLRDTLGPYLETA
ncbi:MAG: sigma-70 family RNA polymerase sigma factor [Acidobacteriota bacterium]